MNITPVYSIPGPGVDDPANQWAPYGPFAKNLLLLYYASETEEFAHFEQGQIDVVDWEPPASKVASYDANPDFVLSPTQGLFGLFGIYLNMASTTWTNWGCTFDFGNSQCGIDIREGLAHLLDRPRWVVDGPLQGTGAAIADDVVDGKIPSGSSLANQCSWDALHPSCISAFNIAADSGGFAMPGSPDFCAAADHMIVAGVASGKTDDTCFLTGVDPSVFTHPLRFMIRSDTTVRLQLGNGLMRVINQLMGGSAVTPTYGNINQIGFPIVFSDIVRDDWDAYTYGRSDPGIFADALYSLYHSQGASDACGGSYEANPDNAVFVCIQSLDQHLSAAFSTDDLNRYISEALAALDDLGRHAVLIPVYSEGARSVALRSVAGLVKTRGNSIVSSRGYSNLFTMLYAHQDASYTPENPAYRFGGGDPTTLRLGVSFGTNSLNIYNAAVGTPFERTTLVGIYDTLFIESPIEPGKVFCWMCNSYTRTVDPNGNTHFLVELKRSLRWHDGVPVDAYDVKFSLLSQRDYRSSSPLRRLSAVNIIGPSTLDIIFTGRSFGFELGLVAWIVPRHLWELSGDRTYGEVGRLDPAKSLLSYDPLVSNALVGSGPFVCRSVFPVDMGRIGGGCAVNVDGTRAGQSIRAGGTMRLQAFDRAVEPGNIDPFNQYMRSYNPSWATGSGTSAFSGQYQEWSWADVDNDEKITVLDVASVASCYGASGPLASCTGSAYSYWLKPTFHQNSPSTISSEVAVVASHVDDTWIPGYSWRGMELQNIIPFNP